VSTIKTYKQSVDIVSRQSPKASFRWMDGWMFSGWSSTPAREPQDEPNVHHDLSLMPQSLIFVYVLGSRTKQFLCCMYLVKIVWSYRLIHSCFLSISWLSASLTPTITVTPDLFLNPCFLHSEKNIIGTIISINWINNLWLWFWPDN
jgi:hypothetical protein